MDKDSGRGSNPLHVVYIDSPDAAERWRRAYQLILDASPRRHGEQGIDKPGRALDNAPRNN